MLRKLSLVAVAAASWVRPRWRRPPPRPTVGTMAAGIIIWLGWPPRLHRRPGLLCRRIWRLLRAAPGPDPIRAPLAAGEPLLLIRFGFPRRPGRRAGAFFCGTDLPNMIRLLAGECMWPCAGNQIHRNDLTQQQITQTLRPLRGGTRRENCHGCPNQQRFRTNRSQDLPVHLRCGRRTVAAEHPPRNRVVVPVARVDG